MNIKQFLNLSIASLVFMQTLVSTATTLARTDGECKEFVGLENQKIEYTTKVCRYENNRALDVIMKRVETTSKNSERRTMNTNKQNEDDEVKEEKDSKREEYIVTGDLTTQGGGFTLENMLYFDQTTVENIKTALQEYALAKDSRLDNKASMLPEDLTFHSMKNRKKKIVITLEEIGGKYTVKDFQIKFRRSRGRRSCDDIAAGATCFNIGKFNTTSDSTDTKIIVKKESTRSALTSAITKASRNNVKKIHIKFVGAKSLQRKSSSNRSRRNVNWLSMESYLRQERIQRSLDLLVDGLSAMTQAHLL